MGLAFAGFGAGKYDGGLWFFIGTGWRSEALLHHSTCLSFAAIRSNRREMFSHFWAVELRPEALNPKP